MSGMGCLDNVERSGSGHDGDSESEKETATHELADRVRIWFRSRLDNNTGTPDSAANHHSITTAPSVAGRADERESDDTTDLVHGGNNTSPSSGRADLVVLLELIVGEESVEHGAIETVASGAEEADECNYVERHSSARESLGWFLELGLRNSLGARDDLFLNRGSGILCWC